MFFAHSEHSAGTAGSLSPLPCGEITGGYGQRAFASVQSELSCFDLAALASHRLSEDILKRKRSVARSMACEYYKRRIIVHHAAAEFYYFRQMSVYLEYLALTASAEAGRIEYYAVVS